VEAGLTEYNLEDAQVKKSLIANADQVIVLADSRKLGETCLLTSLPIECGHSGDGCRRFTGDARIISENGVEVIIAEYCIHLKPPSRPRLTAATEPSS